MHLSYMSECIMSEMLMAVPCRHLEAAEGVQLPCKLAGKRFN